MNYKQDDREEEIQEKVDINVITALRVDIRKLKEELRALKEIMEKQIAKNTKTEADIERMKDDHDAVLGTVKELEDAVFE